MFSAVNTGHCNPKILAAVTEQMNKSSSPEFHYKIEANIKLLTII
jgi:acetylornithine/succinyldiaminopimelate/putrescine aminotransferase